MRKYLTLILFLPLLFNSLAHSDSNHHYPSDVNPVEAKQYINDLPVKGRAQKTGYERVEKFGKAWTDNNDELWGHNLCDTRDDILKRDLVNVDVVHRSNCPTAVAHGTLDDPYTGLIINFTRGQKTSSVIQIDHIVPLSLAWQTGAQQLTQQQRINLANDPLNLIAVQGKANEQKSDSSIDSWMPPNKTYRCQYAAHIVLVKYKYHLWVTSSEKSMLQKQLDSCSIE